jgi:hypothetical protein
MADCRKPYITSQGIPARCGQCPECLTNRKQLWTHRIILESYAHEKSSFVTLTYCPERLPHNEHGVPMLVKRDLQLFIKKLRNRIPNKLRYYAVGEYGTSGERGINPHFHLCLFGVGEEDAHTVQESWTSETKKGKSGSPNGYTYTGALTPQSAAYVAGYVQKKNKYNKDMWDEHEIPHEFSCMSNRPAIGVNAVPLIAKVLEQYPEGLTATGDVPFSLMHGDRQLPLGKTLRDKIREEMDMDCTIETEYNPNTGEIINEKKIWHAKERQKDIYKQELSLMQENIQEDKKLPEDAKVSVTHLLRYQNQQKQKNFDSRQKLRKTQNIL